MRLYVEPMDAVVVEVRRGIVEALPFVLEVVIIVALFWKRGTGTTAVDAVELIKPMPVRGWKVVLGDVAGSAAAGAYPLLALAGLAVALLPQAPFQPLGLPERLVAAALGMTVVTTLFFGFHAILYLQALLLPERLPGRR